MTNYKVVVNAGYNFIGYLLPLFAAVYAFPLLLNSLGNDRFGWLVLVWSIVGYFSLFDLGVAKALTRVASIEFSKPETERSFTFVWTALLFMLVLGIFASILLVMFSIYGSTSTLGVADHALQEEVREATSIIALAIPAVILTTACAGLLEATQSFRLLGTLRSALGILTILVPIPSILYDPKLQSVAYGLVFVRFAFLFLYCSLSLPKLMQNTSFGFSIDTVREFLSFGIWVTLSNIVGPLMLYGDRFFLAATTELSTSGFYATTNDILQKLLIVPSAITGVTFPLFSKMTIGSAKSNRLLSFSVGLNAAIVLSLAMMVWGFGDRLATVWLGVDFAAVALQVIGVLCVGVLFNSIGLIYQNYIQATGRPDITAKLNVLELMIYLPYAYVLISKYSALGAAFSWSTRTIISCIVLFLIARQISRVPK